MKDISNKTLYRFFSYVKKKYYLTLFHSVSCLTQSRVESVVPVSLTVRGGDGTALQESKGNVNFQYRVSLITTLMGSECL